MNGSSLLFFRNRRDWELKKNSSSGEFILKTSKLLYSQQINYPLVKRRKAQLISHYTKPISSLSGCLFWEKAARMSYLFLPPMPLESKQLVFSQTTNSMESRVNIYIYFFFFNKFIYLFIFGYVGLRCCAWAFSSCNKQGLLFVAVHVLLIEVASLVPEHGL